jgi:hypothetical protein
VEWGAELAARERVRPVTAQRGIPGRPTRPPHRTARWGACLFWPPVGRCTPTIRMLYLVMCDLCVRRVLRVILTCDPGA